MDWATIATVVFGVLGVMIPLFLWNRSESNADRREFTQEMKSFHGRLCALEERYIQMMQRFMEERGSK